MSMFHTQFATIHLRQYVLSLENIHNVQCILSYACVWLYLYGLMMMILKLHDRPFQKNNAYTRNLFACIHSIVITGMSLGVLFSDVQRDWVWGYSTISEQMLNVICSYMLSDWIIEWFTEQSKLILLHHSITFSIYVYSATRPFAHYIAAGFLLLKYSTVLRNFILDSIPYNQYQHSPIVYSYHLFDIYLSFIHMVFGLTFSYHSFIALLPENLSTCFSFILVWNVYSLFFMKCIVFVYYM